MSALDIASTVTACLLAVAIAVIPDQYDYWLAAAIAAIGFLFVWLSHRSHQIEQRRAEWRGVQQGRRYLLRKAKRFLDQCDKSTGAAAD